MAANHVYFPLIATDTGHFFSATDGNYTTWSDWSECSTTCGEGKQSRSRTCTSPPPKHSGKNCSELGAADDTQMCNPGPCPIDGNYSQWTEWSDCDVTCGRGVQNRSRSCTSPPPQYDGKSCKGLGPANETKECNKNPCRKCILTNPDKLFVQCVLHDSHGAVIRWT